jgi:DNA-binding response OmpR family regulator
MRVLIIEDEDRLRHMMRLTLEPAYEVGEAASGEAGLERFGDSPVWDAVLLDQRLPGIDGLETLRRLRQRDPGVCVVMITAFASIELAVDAMKLGATDFLRKPVAPDALRGALAAALHVKAERRAGRLPAAPAVTEKAGIVHLTMNGFQIVREAEGESASPGSALDHRFTVVQFASGERRGVTVTVDPEEVARVRRLARRDLKPQGSFWRAQAERLLASHLWVEGRLPEGGRLILTDLPRETIELAAGWEAD